MLIGRFDLELSIHRAGVPYLHNCRRFPIVYHSLSPNLNHDPVLMIHVEFCDTDRFAVCVCVCVCVCRCVFCVFVCVCARARDTRYI